MNRESLDRQNPQMTVKPVPTSGRSKMTSFIVITMNFDFKCMCRLKKHSHFHQITYHADLEVLQEIRIDDFWNVNSLVKFLEKFHEVHSVERKISHRIYVVREE